MKTKVFSYLLALLMFPSIALAQSGSIVSTTANMPAKGAQIASFHVSDEGVLYIVYSDGTVIGVPKEKGRFKDGSRPLTQQAFSDIQVARDRRHIGWFASYMVCQQSDPCNTELVIYRAGHMARYIDPPDGIMWRWNFLKDGKQAVVQFGPPHGNAAGTYALYDADTGDELSEFYPKNAKAPDWVRQLK